ncbi:uncharacterized protein LOC121654065 [Melanotaenia boesemani]|uniref:uncharacterized protein LOC121654065 n=1 Tax=Melanotaenia boesemani TaxID=1250792 RepID=UPI001C03F054|nr:uncharacterized protein LOC121654065 [Melanotaenia boesemani]
MPKVSLKKWKSALTSIIEELDESQYKKMLLFLKKVPKGQKTGKVLEDMVEKIIECYGERKSITVIKRVMDKIPRKDAAVQGRLKPFLVLEKEEKKRGSRKKSRASWSPLSNLELNAAAERSCPPEQDSAEASEARNNSEPISSSSVSQASTQTFVEAAEREGGTRGGWRKTIMGLISSGNIEENEAVVGKVVQMSKLLSYKTRDGKERMYFNLSIADETGCIRVMVYGEKHHSQIKIDSSYLFRKLKIEEKVLKVFFQSKVLDTKAVEVPEEVEMEAKTLLHEEVPVCSIAEVKKSSENASVSIQGVVTEINPVIRKNKTRRQIFDLKDETGSISICMWGKETLQCSRMSTGDTVKVTGLKIHCYYGQKSLKSTGYTTLQQLVFLQICCTNIQTVRIKIQAITKANKTSTHVEAESNQQLQTLIVPSRLLAEAFRLPPDADLKANLLEHLPISAEAEIQGHKVKKLMRV